MIIGIIRHETDAAAARLYELIVAGGRSGRHPRSVVEKETIFDDERKPIGTRIAMEFRTSRRKGAPTRRLELYSVAPGVGKDDFLAAFGAPKNRVLYLAVMSRKKHWFDIEGPELMRREFVISRPPHRRIGRLSLFDHAFIVNDLPTDALRDAETESARLAAIAERLIDHVLDTNAGGPVVAGSATAAEQPGS